MEAYSCDRVALCIVDPACLSRSRPLPAVTLMQLSDGFQPGAAWFPGKKKLHIVPNVTRLHVPCHSILMGIVPIFDFLFCPVLALLIGFTLPIIWNFDTADRPRPFSISMKHHIPRRRLCDCIRMHAHIITPTSPFSSFPITFTELGNDSERNWSRNMYFDPYRCFPSCFFAEPYLQGSKL